ncbi:MAG TPA: hypothetical protein VN888_09125 [Mycobacterium sp.]|nr:hypothetical protein [Mycobacterium sp.]
MRLWADLLLIPAARWSSRAAAVLLRLGRWVPDCYLAWEVRRTAGSRDRAALQERPLQWIIAAHREATVGGVRGTAEDYRRFGGAWGFELGAVGQTVTVWQGVQDILLPMNHARRLATALPSSTLRVVASSGHYLPAVIADVVLGFPRSSPMWCSVTSRRDDRSTQLPGLRREPNSSVTVGPIYLDKASAGIRTAPFSAANTEIGWWASSALLRVG